MSAAIACYNIRAQSPGIPCSQALPFLRNHASATTIVALVDVATSQGDIVSAGLSYLKTNLVPKIGANVGTAPDDGAPKAPSVCMHAPVLVSLMS